MAANTAKVLGSVRPHLPLIRFPLRGCSASTQKAVPTNTIQVNKPVEPATQIIPTYQKPVPGSGIETSQLPARLRRQLIEEEEINYIMRGGPE